MHEILGQNELVIQKGQTVSGEQVRTPKYKLSGGRKYVSQKPRGWTPGRAHRDNGEKTDLARANQLSAEPGLSLTRTEPWVQERWWLNFLVYFYGVPQAEFSSSFQPIHTCALFLCRRHCFSPCEARVSWGQNTRFISRSFHEYPKWRGVQDRLTTQGQTTVSTVRHAPQTTPCIKRSRFNFC